MKRKTKYKIVEYGDDIRMRVDYHPRVAKRMLKDLKNFKKKIVEVNPSFINTKEMGIWLTNESKNLYGWSEWELLEEAVLYFEEYLMGIIKLKPKRRSITLP